MWHPAVSFVVVARNAAAHLPALFSDILTQTYPPKRIEIVLVDGVSEDGSRELMRRFKEAHPGRAIVILENPSKTLASGCNVALAHSAGDVILRVDAHARIPPDFVRNSVRALARGAKIAGGVRVTLSPEGFIPKLLCTAERSGFGCGSAPFRRCRAPGHVDTLAHAAYRRVVFETVGGYDERLGRAEDNEIHYRMKKAGFRFFYTPDIRSFHMPRATLRSFLAQKYDNGYWIGLTLGIEPRCFRPRHFVPAVFTSSLLATLALGPFFSWRPLVSLMAAYLAAALAFAVRAMAGNTLRAWSRCPLLPPVFFLIHTAYGLGTIAGLLRMPFFVWENRGHSPVAPSETGKT